jgi:hypothetical protein
LSEEEEEERAAEGNATCIRCPGIGTETYRESTTLEEVAGC